MVDFPLPDNLSPDCIDTLTELNLLLGRFRTAINAHQNAISTPNLGNLAGLPGSTPAAGGSGSHGATGLTPAAAGGGGGTTGMTPAGSSGAAAGGGGAGAGAAGGAVGSLTLKELPAATDTLKHKFQRARTAIARLPDAGRTLEAQEKEIAELEERKRRQLAELVRIKSEGERFVLMEQRERDEREKMMA